MRWPRGWGLAVSWLVFPRTSQGPVRLAEAGPESGEAVLLLRESREPLAAQDVPSLPGWGPVWEQAWAPPVSHGEQLSGARLSEARELGWGLLGRGSGRGGVGTGPGAELPEAL